MFRSQDISLEETMIFQYFKVLIMITVCKSKFSEILLNFNSIYLILIPYISF